MESIGQPLVVLQLRREGLGCRSRAAGHEDREQQQCGHPWWRHRSVGAPQLDLGDAGLVHSLDPHTDGGLAIHNHATSLAQSQRMSPRATLRLVPMQTRWAMIVIVALLLTACVAVPGPVPGVVIDPADPYYYSPTYCVGCWYGQWGGRIGYHRGGGRRPGGRRGNRRIRNPHPFVGRDYAVALEHVPPVRILDDPGLRRCRRGIDLVSVSRRSRVDRRGRVVDGSRLVDRCR